MSTFDHSSAGHRPGPKRLRWLLCALATLALMHLSFAEGFLFPTPLDLDAPRQFTWYGYSVAASGSTVVVGAPFEGRHQSQPDWGGAYVFERIAAGEWSQPVHLSLEPPHEWFGWSVAISGDTLVVGVPLESSDAAGNVVLDGIGNSLAFGAAFVYARDGGDWVLQARLKASNAEPGDQFGYSVAISGDTVVVGAHQEDSNATGVDGDQTNNAASNSGAAYVFVRAGTTWSQQAYLKASNTERDDRFGRSVSIFGETVVVGAPGEASDAQGVNGPQNNNLAANSGAAYVFVRQGTQWSQQAYLKASNSRVGIGFGGRALAIWGDTLVVGASSEGSAARGVNGDQEDNSAPGAGSAYVFTREGGQWSQEAYLKASNTDQFDQFGSSVAVHEDLVLVGAIGERSNATGVDGNQSDNSVRNAGAAYAFVRDGDTWSQAAYLKAPEIFSEAASFGNSVAATDDFVVVGAPYDTRKFVNQPGGAHVFERYDAATTPTLGFAQTRYFVREGERAPCRIGSPPPDFGVCLSVRRWGPLNSEVSVSYRTVSHETDTAESSMDYVPTHGSLTFFPGQDRASIFVPVWQDAELEDSETFTVELFIPTGGAILDAARSSAVVTILDGRADLRIVKGVADGRHWRQPGELVEYVVEVINWGPSNVEDAEVQVQIRPPLVIQLNPAPSSDGGGWTYEAVTSTLVWRTGPMSGPNPGKMTRTLSYWVVVPDMAPTRIESAATVQVTDGAVDAHEENNTDSTFLIVGGADLAVRVNTPLCGSLSRTSPKIFVDNLGPETSGAFHILIEAGTGYDSFDPVSTLGYQWNLNGSDNKWIAIIPAGRLAPRETLTVWVDASVKTNLVSAWFAVEIEPQGSGAQVDLNPDNNRSEVRFQRQCPGPDRGGFTVCALWGLVLTACPRHPNVDVDACLEQLLREVNPSAISPQPSPLAKAKLSPAQEEPVGFGLAPYYAMREVLRQSQAGSGLVDLYEIHSPEIVWLLMDNLHMPGFLGDGISVLWEFQAGYARLLAGDGDSEFITQEMIDRVNRVADRFVELGSEALREAIEVERAQFNHLQDFVGASFGDWARILGVHVPDSPWLVVSSARRFGDGELFFEVNHVPGHAYSVWRTADLGSPDWVAVEAASIEVVGHSVRVVLSGESLPLEYYRVRAVPVVAPQ